MQTPVAAKPRPPLIESLRSGAGFPHAVSRIELIETHISWVILTGEWAYKIKKPLRLAFLDFSTLDQRRHFCEDEVRLNRRLAPGIYDTVLPITGTADRPRIGGDGAVIEYAVRMREFTQGALAANLLDDRQIGAAELAELASTVAAFHAAAGIAACGSPHGTPESIAAPTRANMAQLRALLPEPADQQRIAEIADWTEREYQQRWAQFEMRCTLGCIRECHGDLHLGNIALLDGRLTPFDCIEFDPGLRWIDVMNEIAFLVMDLLDRQRADLAYAFLNAYLEAGGDYGGLPVLPFYVVYRAMVRAKIHALRAAQDDLPQIERARCLAACRTYLELARHCTHEHTPAFILMHGLSGSGKSVLAQHLAQHLGGIRIRSDVERKRISGLAPLARSASPPARGLYTTDITSATYHRLIDIARNGADAGYVMIVDATFLKRWQRDKFRREASARGLPCFIVDLTAPEAVLRQRIAARLAKGHDPSEADDAVLTQQLAHDEPLSTEEAAACVRVDTTRSDSQAARDDVVEALRAGIAARRGTTTGK